MKPRIPKNSGVIVSPKKGTPMLSISILLLPVVRPMPGVNAQCDVVAAGCVVKERLITVGRVVDAGCVANEHWLAEP
jgi:hypothetical protein